MADDSALPRATDLTLAQQVSLLSGGDFWHTRALPDAHVPATMLTDGPHGIRRQRGSADHLGISDSVPATCFPTAVTLASSWDEDLLHEVGQALGAEAKALDVGVLLGPGLNLKRHPLGGRNFEYFSEDPLVSGRLAAALVRGIQSQGVGACLKHYAVNNQEDHRFVVDAVVDERTLRELYLAGFEHVVKEAQPWTVMAAYNSINGTTATEHHELLTEILREEWGFDGMVVSDWGASGDRVAGIAAGMDLAMPANHGIDDGVVADAVRSGRLSPDAVTTSAQRVLDLVARAGSAPTDNGQPEPALAGDMVGAHDALARRAAAAGAVLLTNDGLLPLSENVSVALVGPFADSPRHQGAGSSLINPTRLTTARAAFAAAGIRHTWDDGSDPARAARLAAEADVAVVMVGVPAEFESEGFDRKRFALPDSHVDLIEQVCRAQPRAIVVLSNGGPVATPWRSAPAAILETYLGGQASGAALVDMLFGAVEPGGRLAESFPESVTEMAADQWFPGVPRQVEHREGLFVGYRHLVSAGVPAAYPFGHGLGYTTFAWSEAALSDTEVTAGDGATVSVTVTNTGPRAGSDVVQIYRRDLSGVVLRPQRELVGFAKVRLGAGESTRVEIPVPGRGFAFWDRDAHDWEVPGGPFVLEVARSCVDVVAELPLTITGGVTTSPEGPDTPRLSVSDADFERRLGRTIPTPIPMRPFTKDSTFEELAATRAGALLRAALLRANPHYKAASADPRLQAMVERTVAELPLRAAAQYSGGRLTWSRVDLILKALNRWAR